MFKIFFLLFIIFSSYASAFFIGKIIDEKTSLPVSNALIIGKYQDYKSDKNGTFVIDSNETSFHVKALGYRPYKFQKNSLGRVLVKLKPIKVKALYLTFWGASNKSKTLQYILEIIEKSEANAIVMDVKNEYGSTSFYTGFKKANSYGAHENRTNRNIKKFISTMKEKGIYTIARVVTFKDELQATNNPDYAIKSNDENKTIWRNHDNMAWVDPFDVRSHEYAIRIAQEAAKVGFDEINFDYIRFPAQKNLILQKPNTQKNRVKAIEEFLKKAKSRLHKYGVFISVDTYGNICWTDDDNGIGQVVSSLAKYADYLAPMLYPSGFACGSFYFDYPAEYPYEVIYRSIKTIQDKIPSARVRPWLQYFKDYGKKRLPYRKIAIQAQIRASDDVGANGWMLWSPSSKYHLEYLSK
ncbi:putative glycoside hydrolase [Sulfurimonas sp.]